MTMVQSNTKTKNHVFSSIFWGITCFFAMSFNEGGLVTVAAFLLSIYTFYLVLLQDNQWLSSLPKAFFLLCPFVAYQGLLLFFSVAPKLGYGEYCKLVSSFCICLIFLCQKKSIYEIIQIIVISSTITSFLSLDLISTQLFSGFFQDFMGLFTEQYSYIAGIEPGVRMRSLFSNPNVFAGFSGISVIFSLGMVLESDNGKERSFFLHCLYWNSLAFVLAFSLGAIVMISFAFLFYLLIEPKKIQLLLLMVETFIFTLAGIFPIFMTSFQLWEKINPIPLLVATLGACLLCLNHEMIGRHMSKYFMQKKKDHFTLFLFVFNTFMASLVLAFLWTEPLVLQEQELIKRSMYPTSGEYELQIQSDDLLYLRIESQNLEDTMQHTSTILYRDDTENVIFTVPEDSIVVNFYFYTVEGATIQKAQLSDGQTMTLSHKLLPGFVTTRLQGLWANQNFIQRLVFFADGLKIVLFNPIFGSGMGTFESTLFRVQDFYYTTKYAHNHYIQVLLEAGLIGFSLLMALCISVWKGLWRLKKQENPLISTSLTVLLFSLLHALLEMTWSIGSFSIIMFSALGVFFLQTQESCSCSSQKIFSTQNKILGFLLACILLQCANFHCYLLVRSNDNPETFLKNLEIAIFFDPFEKDDYRLSYLHYVGKTHNAEWISQAERYITKLNVENSNIQAYYVAEFYLQQGNTEKAMDYLLIYGSNGASHPDIWNSSFQLMQKYESLQDETLYEMTLNMLYTLMIDWNESHIGASEIEEDILIYLQDAWGIGTF